MTTDPKSAPFFYTSKASRSERDLGCEHLYWKVDSGSYERITREEYESLENDPNVRVSTGCVHPTVKPKDLMSWIIEDISPEGGTVLDPFAGSGTTGVAAMESGRSCKMIDLDENGIYRDIIEGRIFGNYSEIMSSRNASDRPDVDFTGELPDENPNDLPDETTLDELFSFGS